MEISAADLGVREGQFPSECFTDGGVYDNLGTRAFPWLERLNRVFDQILVSDAGKPFQVLDDASLGMIGQSMRATDILWDRVSQLERESFGRQAEGFVFLPITQVVDPSDDPTTQHPVVEAEVQSIRTDRDRFFSAEINSLAQHGYEVARHVCRQEGTLGDAQLPDAPPWLPIPDGHRTTDHPGNAGRRQPAAPTLLSRQLRKSSRRRVWSSLLDWRDWPSYIYVVVAFILVFYVPLQVYQLYRKSLIQSDIIKSIARGEPDIQRMLELGIDDFQVNTPFFARNQADSLEPLDPAALGAFLVELADVWRAEGRAQGVKLGPFDELLKWFAGRDGVLPCMWRPSCPHDLVSIDPDGNVASAIVGSAVTQNITTAICLKTSRSENYWPPAARVRRCWPARYNLLRPRPAKRVNTWPFVTAVVPFEP